MSARACVAVSDCQEGGVDAEVEVERGELVARVAVVPQADLGLPVGDVRAQTTGFAAGLRGLAHPLQSKSLHRAALIRLIPCAARLLASRRVLHVNMPFNLNMQMDSPTERWKNGGREGGRDGRTDE